jgi:hypothetical protein
VFSVEIDGKLHVVYIINFRVKYMFGTCGLKTSFFGILVSFRFTYGT